MRPPLPTLGPPPKKSPLGAVLVISLLLGLSVGGIWWWKNRDASETPPATAAAPTASPDDAAATGPDSEAAANAVAAGLPPTAATAAVATPPPGAPAPAAALAPSVVQTPRPAGLTQVSVRIDGPLETALVASAGSSVGPALAQVVTRTLVWWVDVPGDLRRGDTLDVLYEARPNEEPLVHAVRFASGKTGQTHRAYRFQASGEKNARYYLPTGEELELRLQGSPLDEYEQVTSLLRDGRKHKGVDFKTAVGTPVKAPFTGVVKRKNWSFRFNGNCVELEEVGGQHRRALFLHMEELPRSLQVGDRIAAGALVGRSGNSGRSFAPHLHYQLEAQNDRVLDPYESHRTFRRSLAAAQRPAFETEMRRQDALFGGAVVAGAAAGH